jgi:hypothetical protein
MSQGWWNMNQQHADARRGISTKTKEIPTTIRNGTGSQLVRKEKLNNSIQNSMHACDKALRKAANAPSREKSLEALSEAIDLYSKLAVKIQTYENEHGEMPQWVNFTWMQSGEFKGGGKVKRAIERLASASDAEFESYQKQLFNAIKLGTEQTR